MYLILKLLLTLRPEKSLCDVICYETVLFVQISIHVYKTNVTETTRAD